MPGLPTTPNAHTQMALEHRASQLNLHVKFLCLNVFMVLFNLAFYTWYWTHGDGLLDGGLLVLHAFLALLHTKCALLEARMTRNSRRAKQYLANPGLFA